MLCFDEASRHFYSRKGDLAPEFDTLVTLALNKVMLELLPEQGPHTA
jgi:hypothetical protein